MLLNKLVNKFLSWKLPKDFSPDCGIVFNKHENHHITPVGTNLFTAAQAKDMFSMLLADAQIVHEEASLISIVPCVHDALFTFYRDPTHDNANDLILKICTEYINH